MALRYGSRQQAMLFPPSVEEYVAEDAPVRAYDAFVDALDLEDLGIVRDRHKAGCPAYDPKVMLKLLVYGPSYGIRSSRKLERACHENVTFMWLMGGLKPDHKTIAEFRRRNKKALKSVLRKSVGVCVELGLISGNILFVDGTKMRANAQLSWSWTRERFEQEQETINKRIDDLLEKCERIDYEEADLPSLVQMDKELTDAKEMKERIANALEHMTKLEEKRAQRPDHCPKAKRTKPTINLTDPECVKGKGRQGTHAMFNAQVVTDDEHGLIANASVVAEENDLQQFSEQIKEANQNTGKTCKVAVGDSGYCNTHHLEEIEQQGTSVIVPTPQQAQRKEVGPFHKSKFTYDAEQNVYVCPEGHQLKQQAKAKDGSITYRRGKRCLKCKRYAECTKDKNGRTIKRLSNEKALRHFESVYAESENQEIYKRRCQRAELPFGHIKRNLGAGQFLLRGLSGVAAEFSILATCFNIRRMITILGVPAIVRAMA